MSRRALAIALVLVGLGVRLLAAASGGVVVDEAFTVYLSRSSPGDILVGGRPELNPSGYYLLLHPLAARTNSVFLLRLPSVLLGSASLLFLYGLGVRLGGAATGLWACAMAASSYAAWLAEAQIRMYGLLALCFTATLWYLVEKPPGRPAASLYAALCLALPLVHQGGFPLLAALVVGARCLAPERRAALAAPLAGLAVGAVSLAYSLSGPTRPDLIRTSAEWTAFHDPLVTPTYLAGAALPFYWLPFRSFGGGVPRWLPLLTVLLGVGLWALAARGVIAISRRRPGAGPALCAPFLLVLGGLAAVALAGVQPYQHRYLVPVAGAFYLALAAGVVQLRLQAVAVLLVAVNLVTAAFFPGDPFLWNSDWRSATEFVRSHEQPGDALAAYIPYALLGFNFRYHPGVAVDFSTPGQLHLVYPEDYAGVEQVPVVPASLGPELERRLAGRRVFLLLNQEEAGGEAIRRWFGERYGVLAEREQPCLHSWGQTSIYLLLPRESAR